MANKGEEERPVAVVTGSSSGFGLLTSVKLAQRGFRVAATMRNVQRQGPLLEHARQAGVAEQVEVLQLDVTQSDEIREVADEVLKRYGRIDALVNNAGFAVGGFIEEVPLERYREQLETNFFGLVAMTKAVLPHMRERRTGCIVNVSSLSGRFAFPGYSAYASSKYAVEGFSESLRLEMKPFGVRVVLIEPGAFRTEIWTKGFSTICTSETSPYKEKLERILHYAKRSAGTAPEPDQVADKIVHVITKRGAALRYPLPRSARAALWGKAVLPWSWYERVVQRLLK